MNNVWDCLSSSDLVWRFQKTCGVSKSADGTVTASQIPFWFFRIASLCGQEEFYTSVFPFVYWIGDDATTAIARKTVFIWAVAMYIAQNMKDFLKRPRPKCPPVVQLEHFYLSEYGMPSTHAVMALTVPFCFAVLLDHEELYAIVLATLWCSSICLSRIYMGVHSISDVIIGAAFGAMLLFFLIPYSRLLNDSLRLHPVEVSLTITIACFLLSFFYYHSGRFSPAWSDTVAILAVLAGTFSGEALNIGFKGMLSLNFGKYVSIIIGLILLIVVKRFMKMIFNNIFGFRNMPLDDQPIRVAVVRTFFTYFIVTITATFVIPAFVI